jgi:hypothetical protein
VIIHVPHLVPQFRPMLADLGFSYLNLILGRTHSAVSPGGTRLMEP